MERGNKRTLSNWDIACLEDAGVRVSARVPPLHSADDPHAVDDLLPAEAVLEDRDIIWKLF